LFADSDCVCYQQPASQGGAFDPSFGFSGGQAQQVYLLFRLDSRVSHVFFSQNMFGGSQQQQQQQQFTFNGSFGGMLLDAGLALLSFACFQEQEELEVEEECNSTVACKGPVTTTTTTICSALEEVACSLY
jgi:hypothetical protein